jgi:hypothetical protein
MSDVVKTLQNAAQYASGKMAATNLGIRLEVQVEGLMVRVVHRNGLEKSRRLSWREVEAAHDAKNVIKYIIDQLAEV